MSARELWRDIGFGLFAAILGSIAFHGLAPWLGSVGALRGTVLMLGLIVALWTLHQNHARIGRMIAIMAWLGGLAALAVFNPPLWFWLLLPTMALWLTRSLYRYNRLGQALLDGVLCVFALVAGLAALRISHSMFLALWSFFLMQAITALIPIARLSVQLATRDDRYEQARRNAESALQRLATLH